MPRKKPSPTTQTPPQSPTDGAQSTAENITLSEGDTPLDNIRMERFCQEMAKYHASGRGSNAEAYTAAGYEAKDVYVASACANALLKNPKIIERIDCIRKQAVDSAQITTERIAQELARIGFSDITGAVKWQSNAVEVGKDPDTGDPKFRAFNTVALVDSGQLTEAQAAAISEISQTKDGAIKIKFHNKMQALTTLANWKGMLVEKVEHSGEVTMALADRVKRAKDRLDPEK